MHVRILIGLALILAFVFSGVYAIGLGWMGDHEGPGTIEGVALPTGAVRARAVTQNLATSSIEIEKPKQILFGDLHVHSTFSSDAFIGSLPISNGEGAHPPADACDFARFCSALDFWSINDHAESLTPQHWRETVETMRRCDQISGDPNNPDVVPFLGWEWSQSGTLPQNHYGHKNVVLRNLDEARIPARPIAAGRIEGRNSNGPEPLQRALLALASGGHKRMFDLARYFQELGERVNCPAGVPVRDLPANCSEWAETPRDLFAKLNDWGHDSIVIPHGTTWGLYTPPGSTWQNQLVAAQHDPSRQKLIEIYSGHGNAEEYRDFHAVEFDAEGKPHCPAQRAGHLTTCQRAGQIVEKRCQVAGIDQFECDRRAAEARQLAAEASAQAHLTVGGTSVEDWLDAGQCKDCTLPAMNHRPGGSAQFISAVGNFDQPEKPKHFRLGFLASSDTHTARPGTGYKEFGRTSMSESRNEVPSMFSAPATPAEPQARAFERATSKLRGLQMLEMERQSSFFMTGGLVAAHASGRDRDAIWKALERKEVYATSGPRILLWFDFLTASGTALPMGTAVRSNDVPVFRARAIGSLEQQSGCPDYVATGLSPHRLERLCRSECYHPSDRRRQIARIEVVRIRPQNSPDEDLSELIEDPWRIYGCKPDPSGCSVTFQDTEFRAGKRTALYYVRAIEAPSNAVNGGGLRCTYDEQGRCTSLDRCGSAATVGDNCLSLTEERAWSSPIWVDWGA